MQDVLSGLTGHRLLLDLLALTSGEAAQEQPPPFPHQHRVPGTETDGSNCSPFSVEMYFSP